jgi:FtsX-like permease family
VGASYLIGMPAHHANFSERLDGMVLVKRADGVSLGTARAALERVTADYPTARVQDRAQYRRAQSAEFGKDLGLVYVLLGLAVLIALLGIANTLALSVFERTRELGLLRAIGMARRQVRAMVRWESVIIALSGTCLGLLIGLFFSWAMTRAVADQVALTIPAGQLALGALAPAWPAWSPPSCPPAEPPGSTYWPRSPPSSGLGDKQCGEPAMGAPHASEARKMTVRRPLTRSCGGWVAGRAGGPHRPVGRHAVAAQGPGHRARPVDRTSPGTDHAGHAGYATQSSGSSSSSMGGSRPA